MRMFLINSVCDSCWGEIVFKLLTPAIITVGWFVLYQQQKRLIQRKDVWETVNRVLEKLPILETLALEFHTQPSYSSLVAAQITHCLTQVTTAAGIVSFALGKPSLTKSIQIQLRRAITLNNFDKSNFRQLDDSEEQLSEISMAVLSLTRVIQKAYWDRYK